MKLLIDMNLSPQWVNYFISNNIEASHWSGIGKADDPDIEIMEYAKNHDYTIFTHDLDFGTMLAITKADKPSVVQIRNNDVIPDNTAAPVIAALHRLTDDIEKGALVTIDLRKTRITLLPFK